MEAVMNPTQLALAFPSSVNLIHHFLKMHLRLKIILVVTKLEQTPKQRILNLQKQTKDVIVMLKKDYNQP